MEVIQASSSARNGSGGKDVDGFVGAQPTRVENLDGGVKDQDLFALADDDEDDEDEDNEDDEGASVDGEEGGRVWRSAAPPPPDVVPTVSSLLETPPPPVTDHTEEPPIANATPTFPTPSEDQRPAKSDVPMVYRLRRGDTLMGIALRFRLDVCSFHAWIIRLCLTRLGNGTMSVE